jgi:hypothetical protein
MGLSDVFDKRAAERQIICFVGPGHLLSANEVMSAGQPSLVAAWQNLL